MEPKWVKQPMLPLDKAVAMINMDMIGRIKDNKLYIGGVGTGSTFKSLVKQAQTRYGFRIEYSAGGFAANDHTSFVSKHIPVLFFFSGLHSDYHKPSDTWDKINSEDAGRLLNVVSAVAFEIANAPDHHGCRRQARGLDRRGAATAPISVSFTQAVFRT